MTSDRDNVGKAALSKITRRQIMELDTCSHCALCTENCPAYDVSKNPLHAPGVRSAETVKLYEKKFSLLARVLGEKKITDRDVADLSESTYHCTLCGRCREACPFGFQTHQLWIRVREIVNELGGNPENVVRLGKLMGENMNPYGLEPDTRLDWADYTDLEDPPVKDNAEIAYFVGCTTAFKGANHEVAFSVSSLLNHLGEDWTLLGEDEWCCGNPSLISGDEHTAKAYAEHNVEALESRGVKKVITSCAGCFRVIKFEYPVLLGRKPSFEVVHAVEYLREVLSTRDLTVKPTDLKVIYHDPCELSRLGGVVEAPRDALARLASSVLEFDERGIDVRCCGGGGLLQAVDGGMRLAIVKKRLDEAREKGADLLVSACPACKLAFVDGVREYKTGIEVLDILELAARQLGLL
ncbi:MAG TPA: (Fe-S)-binding protein [Candidatus Bathyarchaeia archaeon]